VPAGIVQVGQEGAGNGVSVELHVADGPAQLREHLDCYGASGHCLAAHPIGMDVDDHASYAL
jgi:hypothetical protein